MGLHATIRTPAADIRRVDDTLAVLRRMVMLGVDLMDTVDIYAWGLNQESVAFRDATAPAKEPFTPPPNWPDDMDRMRPARPRPSHRSGVQPGP